MSSDGTCNGSFWTREQDKAFENALAIYGGDPDDRWEKIAAAVTGKTREEIKDHYELLVEDVNAIESGCVPLPSYVSSLEDSTEYIVANSQTLQRQTDSTHGKKSSRTDQERRKGIPWTEEEHRLFLLGLEKYGKGDWRSISRNVVVSRTPTQVASHAQKYFVRLNSENKERRRSSIHDITTLNVGDTSAPPGPITGQLSGVAAAGYSTEIGHSRPFSGSTVGVHASSSIGQPIRGPLISAFGTPVDLPSPVPMLYGVRASNPESLVPGSLANMDAAEHSMPCSSDPKFGY
ncbi:unnamed protein product [Ilex paraguariensis]|uniref:Uncharacterized protein n=1 Tax=Ilex paraguariensis TaxID=185542 RepID=A0ABC8RIS2_9AQUA